MLNKDETCAALLVLQAPLQRADLAVARLERALQRPQLAQLVLVHALRARIMLQPSHPLHVQPCCTQEPRSPGYCKAVPALTSSQLSRPCTVSAAAGWTRFPFQRFRIKDARLQLRQLLLRLGGAPPLRVHLAPQRALLGQERLLRVPAFACNCMQLARCLSHCIPALHACTIV